MLALAWSPSEGASAAPPSQGLRIYGDLMSFFLLLDGAALNVEYRRDRIAFSVGAGPGAMIIPDAVATGLGADLQLHGFYSRGLEVSVGAGPLLVHSLSCREPAGCAPTWIALPSAFIGYRHERPEHGVMFRVGVGMGPASGGLMLSLGYGS